MALEISKIKLPGSGLPYAIKDTVAREMIAGGITFIVAWNGRSTPVPTQIPAGVQVSWGGGTYTGSLKASSARAGAFYLVAAPGEYDSSSPEPVEPGSGSSSDSYAGDNGGASAYDEYVAATVNGRKEWERLGRKDIDLTQYATNDELANALATKVSKSGDTMTGSLTFTGTAGVDVSGTGGVIVGGTGDNTAITKDGITLTESINNTFAINDDGTVVKTTQAACGGATETTTYNFKGEFSNDNDVVRKSDLANWEGSNKYVKKAGDTMTGKLTVPSLDVTQNASVFDTLDVGCGGATIGQTGIDLPSTSKLTFSGGCDSPTWTVDRTGACGSGTGFRIGDGTNTFLFDRGTLQNDSVIRKSDLGGLAFKSSATVTANPTSGSATVNKWKLGTTDTTKDVTFTATTGNTFQHQPEGTVSLPTVTVPVSGNTVTALGTGASKTVVTSVTLPEYTEPQCTMPQCTMPQCTLPTTTLPTLTMTMGGDDGETLNIDWSAGSHTAGSYTDGSYTDGSYTAGTWTDGNVGTGASIDTSATVTALSGASNITATVTGDVESNTKLGFTGKKYLVTSKFPGALETDGTESAAVTLDAPVGTENVSFS